MTTLADYRAEVADRVAQAGVDPQSSPERLNRAINRARRQLTLELDWYWTLTTDTFDLASLPAVGTVVGRALPDGFLRTKAIVDLTYPQTLQYVPLDSLYRYEDYRAVYSVAGTNHLFIPGEPRDLLHLYFRQASPLFDDQEQDPLIPSAYEEGVLEYAAYLVLRFLREDRKAASSQKAYEEWVKSAADNRWAQKSPPRMRPRPGGFL